MAIVLVVAWGCRSTATPAPRANYVEAAANTDAPVVQPVINDASDQIVSWVDGSVVTDWAAEIARRDHAIETYLNDTDPARAATYGFRSGQNPKVAWSWFKDNPVGFNGVPFVLFKTLIDLDPNDENPSLRAIARIWKREAALPQGTGAEQTRWTRNSVPTPAGSIRSGIARSCSGESCSRRSDPCWRI